MPETLGSGAAFLDANGDGWADVLLVNGKDWQPKGRKSLHALYRNNRNGTFTERHRGQWTRRRDVRHGRGRRRLRQRRARRRLHHGARRGLAVPQRGELQVPRRDPGVGDQQRGVRHQRSVARLRQGRPPRPLRGQLRAVVGADGPVLLARRHQQVVLHAGVVQGHRRRSCITTPGVAGSTTSARRPGSPTRRASRSAWPCSTTTWTGGPTSSSPTTPSRTSSIATTATARSPRTASRRAWPTARTASRAARWASTPPDYDGSGRPHLLVGNFSNQMLALYHNEGSEAVRRRGSDPTVGRTSLLYLAFGVFFVDYDLDGKLDIFAANGHIEEEIGKVQPKVKYQEPPLMFRNLGKGKYEHGQPLARGGVQPAAGGARGGARRLRPRRRPRHPDREQPRTGTAAAQRRRQREQVALREGGGQQVQPERDRGDRPDRRPRRASSGTWCGAAGATPRRATWR